MLLQHDPLPARAPPLNAPFVLDVTMSSVQHCGSPHPQQGFDREGEPSQLAPIYVFVSTQDPLKEPPLITANTVLSIHVVDYPVDKVSCYVFDDGSTMLTFEALAEMTEFARKRVPFCKKHNIESKAPEFYFAWKIDYLKDKIQPSSLKERRAMKREYEEFKVRINALVTKAQKNLEKGWTMQDDTPWPGNNPRDHPIMIQVLVEGLIWMGMSFLDCLKCMPGDGYRSIACRFALYLRVLPQLIFLMS